jgi:hypothetical protein
VKLLKTSARLTCAVHLQSNVGKEKDEAKYQVE